VSKKVWIIFAAICIVLLGSLIYISSKSRVNVDGIDPNTIQPGSEQSGWIGDNIFGKADSPVTLIEYGDFQCPGCGSAHPTVKKVTEKYKNQLAFVFRNFPLTSIHPNARAASAAAEAAGLQGKYWDMHNMLYENQASWESLGAGERTNFFASYADDLELDAEKFKTDMAGRAATGKINFDLALGKKAGVDATPTFFLNGELIDSSIWQDEAKFEETITTALRDAGVALPK
jgi:protein-disulfide isomerase